MRLRALAIFKPRVTKGHVYLIAELEAKSQGDRCFITLLGACDLSLDGCRASQLWFLATHYESRKLSYARPYLPNRKIRGWVARESWFWLGVVGPARKSHIRQAIEAATFCDLLRLLEDLGILLRSLLSQMFGPNRKGVVVFSRFLCLDRGYVSTRHCTCDPLRSAATVSP